MRTDKKSGITNDPNDWATEVDDPRYIVDLVKRVTIVSVRTVDIVATLPELPQEGPTSQNKDTVPRKRGDSLLEPS